MGRRLAAIAALLLSLGGPLAKARADMRLIPPITGSDEADAAIVLTGLALSLAAVLYGLWLARRKAGCMLLAGLVGMLAGVATGFPVHFTFGTFLFIGGLWIGLRGLHLWRRQDEKGTREAMEKTGPDDPNTGI
jgi:hypothetical protein